MKACPACNSRYDDDVTFCSKDGTQVVVDKNAQEGLVGTVIAERYRLMKKLGEGGMGEVYVAEHVHIEKRVALKLLRPEVLSNQEAVTRFKQEARSASSIGHENIIEIDDFGTLPDGRVYLTMEFLDGKPLADIVDEGPVPIDRALNIMIQTGRGLAAAHAKGIVHRDMKPENIYVTFGRDGREVPKILDFGIAKVSGGDGKEHLTRTGTIFGTPFYMAPEQALGQGIDHRADIYAMGVILYQVFTGAVPFKAESFMGILTQHITAPPVPPSVRAAETGRVVPPQVEHIILRAMAKNPADRPQTMNDLVAMLTDAYRELVGAGMTAGFAAPPVNPSQFIPVPTSYMAAAKSAPHVAPTPLPYAATGAMTPGGGMNAMTPGSGLHPLPMGASQAYSAGYELPRKSKGGVIALIVIVVLLACGSAAAWYFAAGPGKTTEGVAGAGVDAGVVSGHVTGAGTGTGSTATGTGTVVTPTAKADAGVIAMTPPEVKTTTVLVDSVPRGAAITIAGKVEGDTPFNVPVVEGKPVELLLALHGFEDERLVIDGIEDKVTKKLQRVRRSSGGGGKGGGKGGNGGQTGGQTGGNTGNTGNNGNTGGDDSDELE